MPAVTGVWLASYSDVDRDGSVELVASICLKRVSSISSLSNGVAIIRGTEYPCRIARPIKSSARTLLSNFSYAAPTQNAHLGVVIYIPLRSFDHLICVGDIIRHRVVVDQTCDDQRIFGLSVEIRTCQFDRALESSQRLGSLAIHPVQRFAAQLPPHVMFRCITHRICEFVIVG